MSRCDVRCPEDSRRETQRVLKKGDYISMMGDVAAQVVVIQVVNGNLYKATILDAAGISSGSTIKDFLMVAKDEPIHDITISWQSPEPVPSFGDKVFLWQAVDNFFGESDFIVDDKNTSVLRIPERSPVKGEPVKFFEMFAGGIAGWSSAAALLRDHHNQPTQVVAIEHDLTCAKCYAIGHDAVLIDGFHDIAFDHFTEHAQDHIIHGDVWSKAWLPAITFWAPDVAAVSSPCQPWSSASKGLGLESRDGLLLAESIGLMKIIRPRILLLEQVGGFATHGHKSLIVRQLRWAGFIIKWERSVDLQGVAPVKRVRWLALAIRMQDPSISPCRFVTWKPREGISPKTHHAVLQGNEALDSRLQISSSVMLMAQDIQLLPPKKRHRMTPNQVLQTRCSTPEEIPGCFMASYGSQHEIRRELLEEKGLYVHFLHDPQSTQPPRFWHPVEILSLHSTYGSKFLPHDWTATWKIIGNHIAVPHALMLVVNAYNTMPSLCDHLSLEEVLTTLELKRWKVDSLFSINLSEGVLVTQASGQSVVTIHEQNFRALTEDDAMPPKHCWTIDKGFWDPTAQHVAPEDDHAIPNAQEDPEITSLTPRSCATTEPAMSQTQQFTPLLKGQLILGQRTKDFWFAADVPMGTVLSVWDHHFMIDPHVEQEAPIALRLIPAYRDHDHTHEKHEDCGEALVLFVNDQLTIYADNEDSLCAATSQHTFELYDQFGVIPDLPKRTNFIATPYEHFEHNQSLIPSPQMVIAAAPSCTIDTETTIGGELRLIIKGPCTERTTCALFWQHILAPDVLQSLAIRIDTKIENDSIEVLFAHHGDTMAYPTPGLRILLMVNAFRFLFEPMRVTPEMQESKMIRIRWLSRTLWKGHVQDSCTLQVLITCQTAACLMYSHDTPDSLRTFRIVSVGKMLWPEHCVGTCRPNPGREERVFNFIPACHGGGPAPTNKQGQIIQVKNSLAGSLLQEGFDLEWVSKTLDDVVKKVGIKEILPVTSMPQGIPRMQAILSLIKQSGFEIPDQHAKLTSKFALQQKQKRRITLPSPKNYLVQDGSLLNQDDSVACQLKEFAVHHRGFYLATYEEAAQWVKADTTVSSDELAIVVFGQPEWETRLTSIQTTLPCQDEQMRPVLVAVTIFQLGESHVKIKKWADQKVDTPDSAFRAGKQATSPTTAQSLQVHCSVKENELSRLLKESGHNNIWATPKQASGKPCDKWRMIWLPNEVTLAEAKIQSAKIPQACGLGRSGARYAVRVPKAAYEASWKLVNPDTPPPEDISIDHLYKLEHLPFGTTAAAISQWANHLGWKVKPIRALGPRGWLIGTPMHPASEQLAFNGSPVLTRHVKPRQMQYNDPILAGPKPTNKAPSKSSGTLGPLIGDPWARYQGPSQGPRPSPAAAAPASHAGTIGPMEQRLQLQEERLSKIEESIAQNQNQMQNIQHDIETKDHAMRSHVDQKLGELRNEIDTGFSAALKQQASHFDTSMNEIKQLLIQAQQSKRKTPEAGDEEM
eukprot:Skav209698  [mRNA]  locus=scaffold36:108316:113809:+ [translate_table: standard]